ncbi:hypothetical protein A5708_10550 [Mycobacterium colombiense]|uniref:Uncharacterized protein n=2 Tax=Mycobacterium colombiense TaxID=339268 RepID=A0A1A2YAI0_9MYCO|nr:hypothetical protein A5708_10550 [Mycobacterium colombiense]
MWVGVLLIMGIAGIFGSSFLEDERWQRLVEGLGDAFFIAAVVAYLVDPLAQAHLAQEWGRDLYWAIFSPHAPAEFKEAHQNLAAPDAVIEMCTHELNITHAEGTAPEVLTIDWQISIDGKVVNRAGLKLDDQVFVVRRHDGSASSYTYWSFQSEGRDQLVFDEDGLHQRKALRTEPSGRRVLDQSKLWDKMEKVEFGKRFWSDRHVITTRLTTDYLTLFQPRMVLKHRIVVRGPAASKLDFYITQLGARFGELEFEADKAPDGTPYQFQELHNVAFPGQTTLLFWHPKDGVEVKPTGAAPDR